MTEVSFPYGKSKLSYRFDDEELLGVLTSSIEEYEAPLNGTELVEMAMQNPIGSPKLSELAKGKQNVVIIASDHTRPVPLRSLCLLC